MNSVLFCSNTKFLIENKGMTWVMLSNGTGISNSYFTLVKNETANITIDKAEKISNFFSLPIATFFLPATLFQYIVTRESNTNGVSIKNMIATANHYYAEQESSGKRSYTTRSRKRETQT